MTKSEQVRAYALEQVGSPYVFGATADECTPGLRRQRIAQYPEYADHITRNCPVLSGKASSCTGCDDENELAHDCAQLTRFAAEAAGLSLPSGATSQWNKGDWLVKGPIDQLPRGYVAFLYHRKKGSTSVMSHTGVYLGDGMVSDARGHDDGVKHSKLESYPWTHFAILVGMDAPAELAAAVSRPTIRQGSKGESVRELQRGLRSLGYTLEIDGKFGPLTAQCVKTFQGSVQLERDGVVGPMTWAALDKATSDTSLYTVTVTGLSRLQAEAIVAEYGGVAMAEGGEANV